MENIDKFCCKVPGCGANLSSKSAYTHFAKLHKVDKAVLNNWLVVKDGNAIGNKSRARPFREGFAVYEERLGLGAAAAAAAGEEPPEMAWSEFDPDYDPIEPADQGTEWDDPIEPADAETEWYDEDLPGAPAEQVVAVMPAAVRRGAVPKMSSGSLPKQHQAVLSTPAAAGSGAAAQEFVPLNTKLRAYFEKYPGAMQRSALSKGELALAAVNEKLDLLLQPKAVEVPVPAIVLNELALQWRHPPDAKLRVKCPVADEFDEWDFADFANYLVSNTAQKDETTRNYTIVALKRFFSLFRYPSAKKGELEPIGVLISAYRTDLLTRLKTTDVMDTRYSFARAMTSALQHYTKFLASHCNKNRWPEAKDNLQQAVPNRVLIGVSMRVIGSLGLTTT